MTKRVGFLYTVAGMFLGASVALVATPAFAFTYDRMGAVAYAHKYACNGIDCHNTVYPYYSFLGSGEDCANFASQVLFEGGDLPMIGVGNYPWWFKTATWDRSDSWASATGLYLNLSGNRRLDPTTTPIMSRKLSGALQGDLYLFDWGKGEGMSHMSIATGDGTFADYVSGGVNYSSITGGKGSHISQHSNDRDWAPWNWGYWNQHDPAIRNNMRTWVVHIKSAG